MLPVGTTIHVTVAGDAGRKRRAGARVHRSRTLELRFLELCDDHGLPRPEVNTRIVGGWRVPRVAYEHVIHLPAWVADAIRLAWRNP